MRKITEENLKEYLAAAKKIEAEKGCLAVRDCMVAWGYNSTSAVVYIMDKMVNAGMLKVFPRGDTKSIYRVAQL